MRCSYDPCHGIIQMTCMAHSCDIMAECKQEDIRVPELLDPWRSYLSHKQHSWVASSRVSVRESSSDVPSNCGFCPLTES